MNIASDKKKKAVVTTTTKCSETVWWLRLGELKKFKKKHGHFKPPLDTTLGRWILNQRAHISEVLKGGCIKICEKRVDALNEIGFTWTMKYSDEEWDVYFKRLKRYKNKYRHIQGTEEEIDDPAFHAWLKSHIQLYRSGQKTKSSEERAIKLVLEMGILDEGAEVNNAVRFNSKVKELIIFYNTYQQYPGRRPENPPEYKLHNWVQKQQAYYFTAKEKINDDNAIARMTKLELFGFDLTSVSTDEESSEAVRQKCLVVKSNCFSVNRPKPRRGRPPFNRPTEDKIDQPIRPKRGRPPLDKHAEEDVREKELVLPERERRYPKRGPIEEPIHMEIGDSAVREKELVPSKMNRRFSKRGTVEDDETAAKEKESVLSDKEPRYPKRGIITVKEKEIVVSKKQRLVPEERGEEVDEVMKEKELGLYDMERPYPKRRAIENMDEESKRGRPSLKKDGAKGDGTAVKDKVSIHVVVDEVTRKPRTSEIINTYNEYPPPPPFIDTMPMWICQVCGERFLHKEDTLKHICE